MVDTIITIVFLGLAIVPALIALAYYAYCEGPIATVFLIATPLMMLAPWWWIPAKGTKQDDIVNVFFGVCGMLMGMGVCIALAMWFGERFSKRHPRR